MTNDYRQPCGQRSHRLKSCFQMLRYNEAGEAFVVEKRRVKGVFLENLELKDFPFDVQVRNHSGLMSSKLEVRA